MSVTLLASKERKAAHGLHRCALCQELIGSGEVYLDERCAEDGHAWTFRSHLGCNRRYWSAHSGMELWPDETVKWSEVLDWEREFGGRGDE